ncbi:MAG: amidohydrolase family protein [Prosthecobacter sp.]|uniref:amidohydrolase family protein n=1 Tax=Prosthecobacter sp. TaxID=1965333 RepID=UPI0025D724CB|nr:amidohydrolase family protein [Prosthecobacter sp.]MCF7785810.1 amidohydrolase family protein [Prosthecobacter sp.]
MSELCNAHTHLELSDLGRVCPQSPTSFPAWMSRLIMSLRGRKPDDYRAAVALGINALRACGISHVHDITNSWVSVEPLLHSGLQGCVYFEVMGQKRERALARMKEAMRRIVELRRSHADAPMRVGLSLHSPWSCHPDLLGEGAAWCRENKVPLCIHVAESPAETELLLTGRVRELGWMKTQIGRSLRMLPKSGPGLRPVPYLEALGVLDARPLLVHAVQVDDQEIETLARTRCAVVHCPRSNALLSCGRMRLEAFLNAGIPVYLGTDSRVSSPDLDVRAEAAEAKKLHAGKVDAGRIDAMLAPPHQESW